MFLSNKGSKNPWYYLSVHRGRSYYPEDSKVTSRGRAGLPGTSPLPWATVTSRYYDLPSFYNLWYGVVARAWIFKVVLQLNFRLCHLPAVWLLVVVLNLIFLNPWNKINTCPVRLLWC